MERGFNYNVGILGHIDSGKTSLVKVLSSILSTAALDKHPESQKRGITLDLGFSAFMIPMPERLSTEHTSLQITLVDCPGHASLIRTIIAGASIIDKILLVVDATKGIQTQTGECIVISELLITSRLIVIMNKIDLVDDTILQQMENKVRALLNKTKFAGNFSIVRTAACPREGNPLGIAELINVMIDSIEHLPDRSCDNKQLYLEIDHCFPVKGLGCILTGTILEGSLRVGDTIEIITLNIQKKIKSIQSFHQNIAEARKGDRVGLNIGPFDSKLIERAVACTPGSLQIFTCCILKVSKLPYFKHAITGKSKYHITCGNETVMGSCIFFSTNDLTAEFSPNLTYEYQPELICCNNKQFFAVLTLDTGICEPANNGLLIGSKFDLDCNSKQCRIGFSGKIICLNPNLHPNNLKICKYKKRAGKVERIVDQYTAIGIGMFHKETDISKFERLKIKVADTTAEIMCSFGKSGKFKINFPNGDAKMGEIVLEFKRLLWDKQNSMVQ